MAFLSDYNKKITSFERKLLFPAQITTIQKFLQDNKDPSPDQTISKTFLESVQKINTSCLLSSLKSECDQKTQKFKLNKNQSLTSLLGTFEQDLVSITGNILKYIEDYPIISLISNKISTYYFLKFMQITRNSDLVKLEDGMKESMDKIGNDLLKFRDKNSISLLFNIVLQDEIKLLLKILPYPETLNSVFFKIFKDYSIQMLMKIYEDYSAQCIREFLVNGNKSGALITACEEGLEEEFGIIRDYTLEVVSILNLILKKSGDDKVESYNEKRKLLNQDIIRKLFKDSKNLLFIHWSKMPSKFLLFIETNILKYLPEIKISIRLDKVIQEKNLIPNFESIKFDEDLTKKYCKKLKKIAKKVFDRANDILTVLGNNNYFECIYEKINDLILKSLRGYCNRSLYKELKKSQTKHISTIIGKLKGNRNSLSESNIFEPFLNTSELIVPSMQKLIIIPNSFQPDFIKDLLTFSSKMEEFETLIYTWKKQEPSAPARSIFDLLTVPFGFSYTQIFSIYNILSELNSSRTKFDNNQKKLGKKLAELIIKNHENCSINLMAFGESFQIAEYCIDYLDSKNFKIIDNLLIFSTNEMSSELENKLNGKVFNFFLSKSSITSRITESWDWYMKKRSIYGHYKKSSENIDLCDIGIDESNMMESMNKIVEQVLIRDRFIN